MASYLPAARRGGAISKVELKNGPGERRQLEP
jgi:hypothetical protein